MGWGNKGSLAVPMPICVHVFASACIYVDAPVLEWRAETGEVKKKLSCQSRKGDGELSLAQRMQSGHGSLAISRGEPRA